MAVTATDIKDCFPEFAGLSDTVIDKWKAQAERRVNLVQWGNKSDDAITWLTAHLLKLTQTLACGLDVAAGPVTTRKVGDLSESYKVPDDMSKTFLASTAYGQYYLTLKTGIWPTRVLGDCSGG